jgi:two-component system, sensor histidine kinase
MEREEALLGSSGFARAGRARPSRGRGRTKWMGRLLVVAFWTLSLLVVAHPAAALGWGAVTASYALYIARFETVASGGSRLRDHSVRAEQLVRTLYTPIWVIAPFLAAFGGHSWGVTIALVMLTAAVLMLISNYSGPSGLLLGRASIYLCAMLIIVLMQWGGGAFWPAIAATLLMVGAAGSTLFLKQNFDHVVQLREALSRAQAHARLLADDLERRNATLKHMHKEAERVAEKRAEFVANVVHEIRTPLSAVVGLTAVLARTQLDARQAELIGLIRSSNDGLVRLSNDILDMAKIDAGALSLERTPFDLQRELEVGTIAARHRCSEKGVVMEIVLSESARSARLWGDAVRVRQIVSNLAGNASKFTDAGSVRVSADVLAGEDPATAVLEISVSDTGAGLTPEFRERIFDRFSQSPTDRTHASEGAGLGLSIVKALVDLMGGRVGCQSEPGRGSTFHVSLPIAVADRPDEVDLRSGVGALDDTDADIAWSRLRVLVVDDSAANRRVLSLMFEAFGIVPEAVQSGEEALASLGVDAFDLVLVDMRMGGMAGDETVARLRSLEARSSAQPCCVVVMSAGEDPGRRDRAMRAGANAFLLKPIAPPELARILGMATTRQDQS